MEQIKLNREKINKELEEIIKGKLFNTNQEENMVYTLGIGISYDRMIELMNLYDKSDDVEESEYNVYVVVGSDSRSEPSGFVYIGADNERMFFGLLAGQETSRPHPLEDVNSIAENQKWCVGKIEFDVNDGEEFREDVMSALMRSYISYLQSA